MAGVTVSGTDGSTANIVVWVFIAVSIGKAPSLPATNHFDLAKAWWNYNSQ